MTLETDIFSHSDSFALNPFEHSSKVTDQKDRVCFFAKLSPDLYEDLHQNKAWLRFSSGGNEAQHTFIIQDERPEPKYIHFNIRTINLKVTDLYTFDTSNEHMDNTMYKLQIQYIGYLVTRRQLDAKKKMDVKNQTEEAERSRKSRKTMLLPTVNSKKLEKKIKKRRPPTSKAQITSESPTTSNTNRTSSTTSPMYNIATPPTNSTVERMHMNLSKLQPSSSQSSIPASESMLLFSDLQERADVSSPELTEQQPSFNQEHLMLSLCKKWNALKSNLDNLVLEWKKGKETVLKSDSGIIAIKQKLHQVIAECQRIKQQRSHLKPDSS